MHRRILLFTLLTLALLAGAAVILYRVNLNDRSRYTDAATINTPLASAPIRQILWQPAQLLPDAGDASADQYEPRISGDGQLLIFVRGRAGANADLFQSRRTPDGWSTPEPVAAINTTADELGPELSMDGRILYFYSDREGSLGGYDLWLSRRDDQNEWTMPVNLGPAVNSEFNEYGPALTPDNARLFFSSNRPRPGEHRAQRDPWPATIREQRTRHDYDLYVYDFPSTQPRVTQPRATQPRATDSSAVDLQQPPPIPNPGGLVGAPHSTPAPHTEATPLLTLNTPHDEGAPALSPAGDFLYFASDRPGGGQWGSRGGFDIFRARILRNTIQPPENLGPAINSEHNDLDPALSTDGFRIYFSSDRPQRQADHQAAATDQPDRYTLYASSSREVFLETDPLHAGELLARLWPWLLSLLAATILAILFYLAMRDAAIRHRIAQLSLMAKCLLISLLLHAALLSAFAAWRVGTAIGEMLDGGGQGRGTQITLGESAGSGSLEAQIRGSLTTLTIEAPTIESARPETTPFEISAPQVQIAATPANLTFTLAPATFTPTDAPAPSAAPAPPPTTPTPANSTLAARTPTPEPAAPPSSESRAEFSPDSLPTRAASISNSSSTPGSIAINPAAAPIAAPASRADIAIEPSAASSARQAAAPSPALNLPPASFAQSAARLPAAPTAGAAVEPQTPSGSLAADLPSAARPNLPGSTTSARIDLAPSAAAITNVPRGTHLAPSASTQPSAASVPAPSSAGSLAATLPSTTLPAARLPSSAVPAASASTSEPTPGSGLISPTSPSTRPSLALNTPSAPGSIHIAPSASRASAPATSATNILAPTEAPAGSALASTPARGAGALSTLPSLAIKPNLPALPADPPSTKPTAPAENFAQRAPEAREEVLKQTGGSPETERAVAAALDWFKTHQSPDGRWSGQHFDRACGHCSSPAEIDADAAMTGITLLCYLGAGHTHQADGPHRDSVRKALAWIVNRTDASGDLRGGRGSGGETMYSQTIAAIALCEAYAMTRDPWLEGPARRAITFVARGSSRSGDAETSVLGWQIMAIKSAQRAGFDVPTTAFDAARRWLDQCASPSAPGRYAYRPGGPPSPAATAEALFVQQLLGRTRAEPRMQQSADFILTMPPSWRREAPTYYWYYATLSLFQHQGPHWKTWNEGIARELIRNQRQDGPAKGSWDPQDEWSRLGGRIYQTAVCTLSLEVYYRYRLEPQPE